MLNNLPAHQTSHQGAPAPAPVQVGLTDSQSFELSQRVAKLFASSTLVPKAYQQNLPNCVIALNMAARMGADPMMTMQNLYVVHGTPSWSAQFLIATFNKCGRFSAIRYEFTGQPGSDDYGCTAKATELATGEVLTGTQVTIGMAKKEGWYQKAGSKWQTMPQQMLMYRAASWFVRAYAPEIAMGLHTAEEVHDTYDLERQGETYVVPARGETTNDLNAFIEASSVPEQPSQQQEPHVAEAACEPSPPQPERKRHTQAELEDMRADMVAEVEAAGISLPDVENAVGEFSNRWNAAAIDKIRNKILPNLKAEMAGA